MDSILKDSLHNFEEFVKKPSKYLEAQPELCQNIKILTKVLYDFAKYNDEDKDNWSTLDELIIDGFNEEQVWAGVELHNTFKIKELSHSIQRLKVNNRTQDFDLLTGKRKNEMIQYEEENNNDDDDDDDNEESLEHIKIHKRVHFDGDKEENKERGNEKENEIYEMEDEEIEDEDEDENKENDVDDDDKEELESDWLKDPDFQHMSDSDGDDLPLFENISGDDEDEGSGRETENMSDDEEKNRESQKNKDKIEREAKEYLANAMKNIKRSSDVEDDFFKLDEMENFLQEEDRKEDIRRSKEDKNHLKINRDENDDENDIDFFENENENTHNKIMYDDFFSRSDNNNNKKKNKKKSLDLLSNEDEDSENESTAGIRSTFEERQLRLSKKIKKLEELAIGEKSWTMSGEVSASNRPENSLLQEILDYDTIKKSAPVITEQVSKSLEDIIIQRIKDKAWDDVERKNKPLEDPYDYKKKLVLNEEKSKLSLAEVYEQEYLKQKEGIIESSKTSKSSSLLDRDPNDISPEVLEIQRDLKVLFSKLNALTHHHFTPKAPSAEVKIVRNVPVLNMEEVAPIGISDETLLAPQEIADKKRGIDIGKDEKSITDSKRERRKKKHKQKLRGALQKFKNSSETSHKSQKEPRKNKGVKSSADFFDKLQTEVTTNISEKRQKLSKTKNTKDFKSVGQFKL